MTTAFMHHLSTVQFFYLVFSVAFVIWVVVRSYRAQIAAKQRIALIREGSEAHFKEAMEVSRQQLAATRELLGEVRGLREVLEKKLL